MHQASGLGNGKGEGWWRGMGRVEGHGFLLPTLIRERQQEARWEWRLAPRLDLTVEAMWAGTSWRVSEVGLWWVDGSGRSDHDVGVRSRTHGLQVCGGLMGEAGHVPMDFRAKSGFSM